MSMKPSLFSRSSEHSCDGSPSRCSLADALRRVVLMLALMLGALSLTHGAALAQSKVAILASIAPSYSADVKSKIDGTGLFLPADVIDIESATPTLTQLQSYSAVLVTTDNSPNDSAALGNVLADYADVGGGVVIAVFGHNNGGLGITGRFESGGYNPFALGNQSGGTSLTLVKDLPDHPILNGVASFNGGESSFHVQTTLTSGSTLVAHWSNNQPLVAVKRLTVGRTVALNFYPPSSDARDDFWVASTDGAKLLANSLAFAGPSLNVTTTSDSVSDDTQTSLREAILFANAKPGPDTITFDATVFDTAKTITLASALPVVTEDLNILAEQAQFGTLVTGRVGPNNALFSVAPNVRVQVDRLAFRGSKTGIRNAGILLLVACQLSESTTNLVNTGTVNLVFSTVERSSTGIQNSGRLLMEQARFAGNSTLR